MPSPKRIRLRDLRKSPGFVTHEQLASVIDAVILIDEQTGGGGGSAWFDGAGTPSNGLGANGDYYLNTTNGDVYEKAGGVWSVVGNIQGPAGAAGAAGVGVPVAGTTGQILAKIDATNYNTEWIDNFTSQVKHEVKAGVALTIGQAVYVTGANGTNIIVGKADNSTEATSSKTMGLIQQTLSINDFGYVVTEGLLAGLDTSAAGAAGDPVWLGTNGNLIYGLVNKPYAPDHLVFIGIVTRKNVSNGEIFINVQNGFELKEIHDVAITSVANSNLLMYESASTLWKNKTLAQVIIATLGGDGTSGQIIQTNGGGVLSWVNNGGNLANQFIKATTGTTITGPQATVTTMISLTVPANTFGSGSVFRIRSRSRRLTPAGASTNIRIVINATNSPTAGSPTILASGTLGTSAQPGTIARTISVDGTTTTIPPTAIGSSGSNDEAFGTVFSLITTIDWTVTQYIILAGTAASGESQVPASLTITPL